MRRIVFIMAAMLAVACNGGTKQRNDNNDAQHGDTPPMTQYEAGTRRMERTVPPIGEIRSVAELNHAIDHYWDDFDFECGERVKEYDTMDMCQALIDYSSYVIASRDLSHMATIIERAETSRPVFDFMWHICETVFHDPNSPMRNDELYIPILEHLVTSPLLDEYERAVPEHALHIAKQNRIGKVANDFEYTLANGTKGRLHDIDANYTLLMFNNPDCHTCRMIIEQIEASPMLNELQDMERLKIVTIYPDSDLEAWHTNLDKMPRRWTVGYDAGCVISEHRLYNLRAIPALYLLDEHKRVLIKDGTDVIAVEEVIAHCESYK